MGYSSSSHYFNRIIHLEHLEDIRQTHIEIDDLLIVEENKQELLKIFRQGLERCWEKNIKLACHKFEAGPKVHFAITHNRGPQEYCPTEAKIYAIINPPAPTNITELRLFIGCLIRIRIYLPNINHSLNKRQKKLPAIYGEI